MNLGLRASAVLLIVAGSAALPSVAEPVDCAMQGFKPGMVIERPTKDKRLKPDVPKIYVRHQPRAIYFRLRRPDEAAPTLYLQVARDGRVLQVMEEYPDDDGKHAERLFRGLVAKYGTPPAEQMLPDFRAPLGAGAYPWLNETVTDIRTHWTDALCGQEISFTKRNIVFPDASGRRVGIPQVMLELADKPTE